MRGLASLELSVLDTHGNDIEAPRLAFAPALDVKIDAACRRHFMRGLASLELSVLDTHGNDIEAPRLAFAPALDVKIDAACRAESSTHSQTKKNMSHQSKMQPPFPRRLLTLGLGGLHRN